MPDRSTSRPAKAKAASDTPTSPSPNAAASVADPGPELNEGVPPTQMVVYGQRGPASSAISAASIAVELGNPSGGDSLSAGEDDPEQAARLQRRVGNPSERKARPKVDWTTAPNPETAEAHRMLRRPIYVLGKGKKKLKRPFDRADAKYENGWPVWPIQNTRPAAHADAEEGEMQANPVEYPLGTGWRSGDERGTSDEEVGGIGGPGMVAYYYVVRYLGLVFFVMGVCSLPTMFACAQGEMYSQPGASRFASELAKNTLGNIFVSEADADSGKSGALWVASFMVTFHLLVALVLVLQMGPRINKLVGEIDQAACTMSDYTVMLMPGAGDGVKQWDEYRCPKPDPAKKTKRFVMSGKDDGDRRGRIMDRRGEGLGGDTSAKVHAATLQEDIKQALKSLEPPLSSQEASEPGTKPIWSRVESGEVKAVVLAWDEDEFIRLWDTKHQQLLQLEAALGHVNRQPMHDDDGEFTPVDKTNLGNVLQDLKETNLQLAQVSQGETAKELLPVAAFVTFESCSAAEDALKRGKLIVGQTECTILPAPEPETINWAHLEYSLLQRRVRQACTLGVTLLFLLIGVIIITMANSLQGKLRFVDRCSEVVGTNALSSNGDVCPITAASAAVFKMQYIDVKEASSDFPKVDSDSLYGSSLARPACTNNKTYSAGCYRIDSAPAVVYENADLDAMCYACICSQVPESAVLDAGYCAEYESDKSGAATWGFIGTVLVVVVNQLLKHFIIASVPWIKAHTVEEEMGVKTVRIYIVQLVNTALLVLIIRSQFALFEGIGGEHFAHVNAKWYASIGAPMLITMVIQFSVPPVLHVVTHLVGLLKMKIAAGAGAKTQNELNAAFAPPARDMAAGYGEMLLATSVCLIYGPGLPLLYWVAAGGFLLRFWVERWADLRVYAKPPLYSVEFLKSIEFLLPILLLLHALFALYFLGTAGGDNPLSHIPFNPFRVHCTTAFLALLVVFLAVVFKLITNGPIKSCFPQPAELGATVLESLRGTKDKEGNYPPAGCLFTLLNSMVWQQKELKAEKLPPFTTAWNNGKIANEDDDYNMDALENLNDLQKAFCDEVQAKCPFVDGTPQAGDLHAQLAKQKLGQLKEYARNLGVSEARLAEADELEDGSKDSVLRWILEKQALLGSPLEYHHVVSAICDPELVTKDEFWDGDDDDDDDDDDEENPQPAGHRP